LSIVLSKSFGSNAMRRNSILAHRAAFRQAVFSDFFVRLR